MDGQEIVIHHILKGTWSIDRDGTIISNKTGKEIAKRATSSSGYLQVGMVDPNSKRNFTTNKQRVIWIAFNGSIPDGYIINHIDGNKENNALSNLECITQRENIKHAAEIGKLNHGRRVIRSINKNELMEELARLKEENASLKSKIRELEDYRKKSL